MDTWQNDEHVFTEESFTTPTGVDAVVKTAALCSLVAALAHAWVIRPHLPHWWVYGAFFAGITVAQLAYALVIVRYLRPGIVALGIAGNVAVLCLYAWSRTVGVPLGPHAGQREAIGRPDLIAGAAEALLIAALFVFLFRRDRGPVRPLLLTRTRWVGLAAALVVAASATAFAAPPGRGHARPRIPGVFIAPVAGLSFPTPETVNDVQPTQSPGDSGPSYVPPPPCTPSVSSAPEPPLSPPGTARGVLYVDSGNAWLYEPASGKNHHLTSNGDTCGQGLPAFHSAQVVSLFADSQIFDLDLSSGTLQKVMSDQTGIMTYDWSPDGKTLAYLTYASGDGLKAALVLFRPADGYKKVIRTFSSSEGHCGSEDDEVHLSWSPDGGELLAVITHLAGDDKMFVVDPSGHDIVDPLSGTHARWSVDGRTVYYRQFDPGDKWFALHVDTGIRTPLGMKPGTHRLSVSPDGSMLAYDAPDKAGTVYVYDIAAKKERKLVTGAVSPIWIDSRTIAVTDTDKCTDCMDWTWLPAGTASSVDVETADRNKLLMKGTLAADVLWQPVPAPPPLPTPSPGPPSPTPSETPTPEPSVTPTETPSATPPPSESPTPDPSVTPSATDPQPSPTETPTG